ncbi:ABC transporter substrate-binding protein [Guyparkeria hydrothermalis]|uniref:ABC transporter substrate-binding protein n=1 Tax=Guyparkeria hydrothermalis TaxID=923 RepID=UPI0020203AD8|nr:ABC transporter substrate-binding protein [Guyparkeria hydrothermalis]MCL7744009.1 ABC transporter substrate-binding protein [Guyparkeria hydrothermalis]
MQRRTFLISAPLAVATFVGGCRAREQPIRLAYHPWVGYETLLLGSQFRWLPPTVSLKRLGSASQSLAALRRGEVDGAALTLDEVIRARLGGMDLVVVMVFDVSAGGDALLVGPGIDSPEDLAGKRIGVELGGVGEMLLDRVLARAGLDWGDVTIVNRSVDQHLNAWREDELDAVVSYEPVASRLRAAGARQLIDSRDFPDLIFDVLAIRRERLDAVDRVLTDVIRAHFRGLHHLQTNLQDAVYRIADAHQVSERAVSRSIGGVLLPGLESNRRYLSHESRLIDAIRTLYPRLSNGDEPPSVSEVETWVTSDYLPRESST